MNILFFAVLIFIYPSLTTLHAQVSNEASKITIDSNNKLKRGEILEIKFESIRENGIKDTGRLKNKAIDENTIEVDFLVEHTSNLNPYRAQYKYLMELLDDGAFQVEMKAALDPMTLRLSEGYTIEYNGDAIYFPANLDTNSNLVPLSGVFSIIKPDGDTLLEYHVEITNRKVELVDVDKLAAKVYQHTYKLHFKNIYYSTGNIIMETQEQVRELLSSSIGMLQQERVIDKTIAASDNLPKQSKRQNKISIQSITKN